MHRISSMRAQALSIASALLFLSCSAAVHASDTFNGSQLTIPAVAIGSATFSNMVVTPKSILSVKGGATIGTEDIYYPANNELFIPSVVFGGNTYTNVLITVEQLVSVGGVTGADTYDGGGKLTLASVQVLGGSVFSNVVIDNIGAASIDSFGNSEMPMNVRDVYNPATGQLTIAAIPVGGVIFTNAVITVTLPQVVSVGGLPLTQLVLNSFSGQGGSGTGGIQGSTDGAAPSSGLVAGADGNFYGTTNVGGAHRVGAVYKMTAAGVETVLYSFSGGVSGSTDGAYPGGLIQGSDGNLYGTTEYGGAYDYGGGTVFRITTSGVETVLYSFGASGITDSSRPVAGLVEGSDGNLYGTSLTGGANNAGTVFKITTSGVETLLHSFTGNCAFSSNVDGAEAYAPLVEGSDGNFYGTTSCGGASDAGTVFKITTGGAETVIYSFAVGTDGESPLAGLIQASDGNFYGTTELGGVNSKGTVFKVTAAGAESLLYSFGAGGSTDGAEPYAGLVEGSDGDLYGTTYAGGSYGEGTVFKVTRGGVETVLSSFSGAGGIIGSADGAMPWAGLIPGPDGSFYGTTIAGGAYNEGTVFNLANVILAQ
jgi:uncharacterized repeat protein (TIGR03803 family)